MRVCFGEGCVCVCALSEYVCTCVLGCTIPPYPEVYKLEPLYLPLMFHLKFYILTSPEAWVFVGNLENCVWNALDRLKKRPGPLLGYLEGVQVFNHVS